MKSASTLPTGGSVEILSGTAPGGPWTVEARVPSEDRSAMLQRSKAAPIRFYRLRWHEGGSQGP